MAAQELYDIVRYYRSGRIRRRVIRECVSLAEARAHCTDQETSSSTATRSRSRTDWFDGYERRKGCS